MCRFGGIDFLTLFYSLTAPKKWFFGWVFSFFSSYEFPPRISPLPNRSRELKFVYVRWVEVLDVLFGIPNISAPFHALTAPEEWFFLIFRVVWSLDWHVLIDFDGLEWHQWTYFMKDWFYVFKLKRQGKLEMFEVDRPQRALTLNQFYDFELKCYYNFSICLIRYPSQHFNVKGKSH